MQLRDRCQSGAAELGAERSGAARRQQAEDAARPAGRRPLGRFPAPAVGFGFGFAAQKATAFSIHRVRAQPTRQGSPGLIKGNLSHSDSASDLLPVPRLLPTGSSWAPARSCTCSRHHSKASRFFALTQGQVTTASTAAPGAAWMLRLPGPRAPASRRSSWSASSHESSSLLKTLSGSSGP